MNKNQSFLLAFLMLLAPLFTPSLMARVYTNVYPTTSSDDNPKTVTYCLPKTILNIQVKAECKIMHPGPFYNYAKRYLNSVDIITQESKKWSISSVSTYPRIMPNTSTLFAIEMHPKSTASNILLNEDGILVGVNFLPKEATNFNNYGMKEAQTYSDAVDRKIHSAYNLLGEDALIANSIPKMAEMAARQIYRIRESRATLTQGESENMPQEGALRIMLNELDEQEKQLISLFEGYTTYSSNEKTYTIDPTEDVEKQVLFRFSTLKGLVEADDLLGEPYYIDIKGEYIVKDEITTPQKEKTPDGIFYCEPGSAKVTISNGKRVLNENTFCMPQFGVTKSLPAYLFDKKYGTTQVILDHKTGRLIYTSTQK